MKKLCMFTTILLCSFILAACSNSDQESKEVKLTVSAAASLKDALDEIKQHYEKEHPDVSLTFNYGSSGSLKQQILQGAPVDLFFSAAIEPYNELAEKGIIEEGTNLLGNELALIVPKTILPLNVLKTLQLKKSIKCPLERLKLSQPAYTQKKPLNG